MGQILLLFYTIRGLISRILCKPVQVICMIVEYIFMWVNRVLFLSIIYIGMIIIIKSFVYTNYRFYALRHSFFLNFFVDRIICHRLSTNRFILALPPHSPPLSSSSSSSSSSSPPPPPHPSLPFLGKRIFRAR